MGKGRRRSEERGDVVFEVFGWFNVIVITIVIVVFVSRVLIDCPQTNIPSSHEVSPQSARPRPDHKSVDKARAKVAEIEDSLLKSMPLPPFESFNLSLKHACLSFTIEVSLCLLAHLSYEN